MEETEKFFNDNNKIKSGTEIDYSQRNNYLEAVKAFARMSYQSLYIIDYLTQSFEYVSDNPLFLCGMTSEEVKNMGYEFYFRNVRPADLEMLLAVNEAGFEFYQKLQVEERKKYMISYDFNLISEKKNEILINHKLTPFFLAEDGKIWKAICMVSLSNAQSAGNIVISKEGTDNLWKYDLDKAQWIAEEKKRLTGREQEILSLSSSGLKINEIADRIFVTPDTIKFHRKKLFEKIGVSNIAEAIAYAKNNKLI